MLAATAAASISFFGWVALGDGVGNNYRLLYRGLDHEQMAKVVDALDAERIPYRLDSGGTAVLVPAPKVYEARIRVASKGLPNGGGIGFEIFDQPDFGVTDFVRRVNFQRALQGELGRSIEQLTPVERARVQLAIPEQSPFVGDSERRASASVILRLSGGHSLEPQQVQGIIHLVASSVEALAPERVSVVDDRGRLLSAEVEGGALVTARSRQERVEKELGQRIQSILEPTLGVGRVVARVSADMDWTQTETTEESFDPKTQIERSEQRSEETSNELGAGSGGIAGAQANLPGGPGAGSGTTGANNTRTTETINYEISKTVSRSVSDAGKIQRLSIAVLVDGKIGGEAGEFSPWSETELKQFEDLARQAVGFSEDRGDEIVISTAPFQKIDLGVESGGFSPDLLLLASSALYYLSMLGALVLFGFLVVRPLARALPETQNAALPARVDELEAQLQAAAGKGGFALGTGTDAPGLDLQVRDSGSVDALRSLMKQG